jgi:hypothetical protein
MASKRKEVRAERLAASALRKKIKSLNEELDSVKKAVRRATSVEEATNLSAAASVLINDIRTLTTELQGDKVIEPEKESARVAKQKVILADELAKLGITDFKIHEDGKGMEFDKAKMEAKLAEISKAFLEARTRLYAFHTSPQCENCGVHSREKPLQRCTRCMCVAYCSKECQREHYAKHRDKCVRVARLLTAECCVCGDETHFRKGGGLWCPRIAEKTALQSILLLCDKCHTRGESHIIGGKPVVFDSKAIARSHEYREVTKNSQTHCQGCTMEIASISHGKGNLVCTECGRGNWCTNDCFESDAPNHADVCKFKVVTTFVHRYDE